MRPEEMLLDPWTAADGQREQDHNGLTRLRPWPAIACTRPLPPSEVPPVRTIVLDRPPVPVAPPADERNPLREPSRSRPGRERLRLRTSASTTAASRR